MERILDQNGTGIIKEFPNGFDSWQETHAEICIAIGFTLSNASDKLKDFDEDLGRTGIWAQAVKLTDQFEKQYKGISWGITINPETEDEYDYYNTIDNFIENNL